MAKFDSRNARRMMQRMGMQMQEYGGVTRVILQSPGKEIVIDQPTVTSINVQGQKIYQITGGKVTERAPQAAVAAQGALVAEKPQVQVPEEDVLLVAQQAKVSMEKARETLAKCDGDLARAILMLQN
ncbi:MAG: nascent polypeptide-associated complex protein [Candidatus Bathyarchaeota archaeon]|nr:nascent polypeptide-associated complex protein [Candidatus Bathyarchaeota archaeon]